MMSGKVIIVPEGERTISPKKEYGKQMWYLNNLAEQKRKNPDTKEERYARDYDFSAGKPIISIVG